MCGTTIPQESLISQWRREWARSIFESEGLLAYSIIYGMDCQEYEDEQNRKWDRIKPIHDREEADDDWLDMPEYQD